MDNSSNNNNEIDQNIMKCINCKNQCAEYNVHLACDKNYYEWYKKAESCNNGNGRK